MMATDGAAGPSSSAMTMLSRSSADDTLELSDSSEDDDVDAAAAEDATAWRACQGDDDSDGAQDGAELDARVETAFASLNSAIEQNNDVERAHTEAIKLLNEQKAAGEARLKPLEKAHARQLRKIEKFRTAQHAANDVAKRLRRLSTELRSAREVLECSVEALELQRSTATPELRADAGWREVEQEMEARRKKAEAEVGALADERKRCAYEMERRAKKVVARSAAIGDVAAEAMPFLAKQASVEVKVRQAEAEVQQRGDETAKAKTAVRKAMDDLETISLDIQRQQRAASEGATYLS